MLAGSSILPRSSQFSSAMLSISSATSRHSILAAVDGGTLPSLGGDHVFRVHRLGGRSRVPVSAVSVRSMIAVMAMEDWKPTIPRMMSATVR